MTITIKPEDETEKPKKTYFIRLTENEIIKPRQSVIRFSLRHGLQQIWNLFKKEVIIEPEILIPKIDVYYDLDKKGNLRKVKNPEKGAKQVLHMYKGV